MVVNKLKKEDYLIYDLIFSEKNSFKIDISDYIDNIYDYSEFMDKIKLILKRAKVKITKSNTIIGSKSVIWELKVKK